MSYGKWEQGFYYPVNKDKYIGNDKPVFRSSWEKKCMAYFDMNKNCVKWASEKIIIPYRLPKAIDPNQKLRRYFTDFYCQFLDVNGNIQKYLVEVKPQSQIDAPKLPKKMTKKSESNYKKRAIVYMINQAKWQAAEEYCIKKGYKFLKLNEQDILNLPVLT
jgi:hypothetical protein